MKILDDGKLLEAFKGDFGEVSFDRKPTQEDIFLIKLKLVAQEAQRDTLGQVVEWGEEHDPHATNVVRSRRECFTCWQELKVEGK